MFSLCRVHSPILLSSNGSYGNVNSGICPFTGQTHDIVTSQNEDGTIVPNMKINKSSIK